MVLKDGLIIQNSLLLLFLMIIVFLSNPWHCPLKFYYPHKMKHDWVANNLVLFHFNILLVSAKYNTFLKLLILTLLSVFCLFVFHSHFLKLARLKPGCCTGFKSILFKICHIGPGQSPFMPFQDVACNRIKQ